MTRNRDSIVGSQGAWLTVKRRIRLVAYGARLESVLGESPRGFESPILRQRKPVQDWDVGPYPTTNFRSVCASMSAEDRKLAS